MDTCVPYFFKPSIDCEPNQYSGFDFDFNDNITIRCYYHYPTNEICYHLFFDSDHNDCDIFTEIKKALIFCETYTKEVHYGESDSDSD